MVMSSFVVFVLIGFAYVLCILAKRETGLVKTAGNALAVSFVLLAMMYIYLVTELEIGGIFWRHDTLYTKLWKSHMSLKK